MSSNFLASMLNYLQNFAPGVTVPMRGLLKERNQFHWDEQVQGCSFKQVKEILSAAPVLKFFDPKEEVELQCDASDRGLGVVSCKEASLWPMHLGP